MSGVPRRPASISRTIWTRAAGKFPSAAWGGRKNYPNPPCSLPPDEPSYITATEITGAGGRPREVKGGATPLAPPPPGGGEGWVPGRRKGEGGTRGGGALLRA